MTPREVAEAYLASFTTGEADQVAAWVTEDFVNEHTAALGAGCVGRDAYRERLPGFLSSFVRLRYDVDDVIADGDRVAVAYTMRASWQGDDGPPVEVRGVQWLSVRGDRIAHRVDYWDSLQFLLQVDPALEAAVATWL